jgi:hypothetical protein
MRAFKIVLLAWALIDRSSREKSKIPLSSHCLHQFNFSNLSAYVQSEGAILYIREMTN